MSQPTTSIYLNSQTPNANAGYQNGKFASDGATPLQSVTVSVPSTGNANVWAANYALQAADCGKLVVIDSGASITVTLPIPPPFRQWNCRVASTGTGPTTITPGSLQLDGSTANLILQQSQSCYIATDGTNYYTARGMGSASSGSANVSLIAVNGTTIGNAGVSGSGGTQPFVVQYNTGLTTNLSYGGPVTAGHVLVVILAAEAAVTGGTLTDTVGTTFTLAAAITGHTRNLAVYYGVAPVSGTNKVTVSGMLTSFPAIGILELYGLSGQLNTSNTQYNSSGTPTTTATTVTTTAPALILQAAAAFHSASVFTFVGVPPLLTQLNGADAIGYGAIYLPYSGTVGCTVNTTSADNSAYVLVAFT